MPAERKCKNWISEYLDWTRPCSMSPESFLIWSGLFCVSSVMKRKVKFSKDLLKMYDTHPALYVIFVGPPGLVTKTSTMGFAEQLLYGVNTNLSVTDKNYINMGPTSGSWVKIVENMGKTADGSMVIMSGELGTLASYEPEKAYDFYSRIFDNPPFYAHDIRAGKDLIINPCLNLIGCTNPDWLNSNSGYVLAGGFAARTIFIFEYKPRQVKMFYDDIPVTVDQLNGMKANLIHDLKIIGDLKGEFKLESKVLRDSMEDWFQKFRAQGVAKNIETFANRKHVHMQRLVMLLSACDRDDLMITESHFEAAKILLEDVEKKLDRGLSSVGRNPFSQELYDILDFIKIHGPVDKNKVWAAFWQQFPDKNQFDNVIETLSTLGEVEPVNVGMNGKLLRIKKK